MVHDTGKPEWDEARAAKLHGAIVLAGFTYVDGGGNVTRQIQFFGMVTQTDPEKGIEIECHGETWRGEGIWLPPDLDALYPAKPGVYRLRSTGEELTDPDYTTSFTINSPPE